jgi:hypothetical protein
LDDITELTALWTTMQFPLEELSKRITEFQVVESPEGQIQGALGLQIIERQGQLHSEAFKDFALADTLRPLLWERIHSLASNHGLERLWTREQAPFWHRSGMANPDKEAMQRLPAPWSGVRSSWLTLKLKDGLDQLIQADKEFAMFMAAEKQRSAKRLAQARALKFIATLVAILVAMLALGAAFYLVRKNPSLLGR